MIDRFIADKIKDLLGKFPVVTLTGARQCGKSTLLKNLLPDYKYISLEDPDIRRTVSGDPRGFLNNFSDRTIIDEAQYVPELFSYIQTKVDEVNHPGMYVLSEPGRKGGNLETGTILNRRAGQCRTFAFDSIRIDVERRVPSCV